MTGELTSSSLTLPACSGSGPAELELNAPYLAIVSAILLEYLPTVEVRAFGSRVTGKAKPFSDLDLIAICANGVPERVSALVADAFAESDLPFKVDLVDASAVDPHFAERALAQSVLVQSGGSR
jgi:predicted nucleotidyltransferase